ncbi:DUF6622 family protein [Ideonella sp. DXS29W]|uniref:DUF6622 family protein n=1 Tax=Ideonella lacteola TaxID=2984193 RepID=A0ABU9BX77_9BURK
MMLIQILSHTPTWVFGLFAALLLLGLSQLATRRVKLLRASLLPLGMLGLSLYGVCSGLAAAHPWVLLVWLKALAVSAVFVMRRPAPEGTQYDAASRNFVLPGSAVPLSMMMAIFFTKYAVGVMLAMQPGLAQQAVFAGSLSLLYGALSGVFLGRAARLWQLAWPTFGSTAPLQPATR